MYVMSGLLYAYVKSGGAVIDSSTNTIGIAQPLLDGGGNGGLTKLGAGTLTLSSANSYVGITVVNAGTLLVSGSVAGDATVAANGMLAGPGTVGGQVTVNGIDEMLRSVLELAREGIFINQICAVAFTPSGESLCKTLRMTYLKPHAERGKVFLITLSDLLRLEILKEYKELIDLYQKHLDFSGHNEQVRTAIP